jgi:hypothetical protein
MDGRANSTNDTLDLHRVTGVRARRSGIDGFPVRLLTLLIRVRSVFTFS